MRVTVCVIETLSFYNWMRKKSTVKSITNEGGRERERERERKGLAATSSARNPHFIQDMRMEGCYALPCGGGRPLPLNLKVLEALANASVRAETLLMTSSTIMWSFMYCSRSKQGLAGLARSPAGIMFSMCSIIDSFVFSVVDTQIISTAR